VVYSTNTYASRREQKEKKTEAAVMSTEDLLTSEISNHPAHPEHKLRKQEAADGDQPPFTCHASPCTAKKQFGAWLVIVVCVGRIWYFLCEIKNDYFLMLADVHCPNKIYTRGRQAIFDVG
jgi:hypothetical protein